jgi:hypothetical protein
MEAGYNRRKFHYFTTAVYIVLLLDDHGQGTWICQNYDFQKDINKTSERNPLYLVIALF